MVCALMLKVGIYNSLILLVSVGFPIIAVLFGLFGFALLVIAVFDEWIEMLRK